MRCNSCHKKVSNEGISFCPHCGAYLRESPPKKQINFVFYIIVVAIWITLCYGLSNMPDNYYFFKAFEFKQEKKPTLENKEEPKEETPSTQTKPNKKPNTSATTPTPSKPKPTQKGVTAIVHNNKYLKQYPVNSIQDVRTYIRKDSLNQKTNCPAEIIAVEEAIINNYDVTAVNLCEMDIGYANEVRNVVAYIYNNYPSSRGYLTNITLANLEENSNFMAAFMPIFTFVTNNNTSGYPMGIKSQVVLNAKYFLDIDKINSSVKYGVSTGYFPKNATRSSVVAHEFGHYLSYIAMLNYYKSGALNFVTASRAGMLYVVYEDFNAGTFSYNLIHAAYEEYKLSYGQNITIDEFRESISSYAMAKDSSGNYIYDETIAEAFHDCYLNGNDAAIASKLILQQVKKYL